MSWLVILDDRNIPVSSCCTCTPEYDVRATRYKNVVSTDNIVVTYCCQFGTPLSLSVGSSCPMLVGVQRDMVVVTYRSRRKTTTQRRMLATGGITDIPVICAVICFVVLDISEK